MDEIVVTCPGCGRRNVIVATSVPRSLPVRCSHCRAELGRWSMLQRRAAAARAGEPPAPAKRNGAKIGGAKIGGAKIG